MPTLRGFLRRPVQAAALLPALLLVSCTTVVGPSVMVLPGRGKPSPVFADDRRACTASTTARLQPVADRRASTTAENRHMFDAGYGGCMAARGNVVLAAAPAPASAAGGQDAAGLSDPDSVAARQSLAEMVSQFRRDCDGERIAVTVTQAVLSPAADARMVELTTPGGGNCFGEPGRNAYLVAKADNGWRRLLSAEPGSITVLGTRHNGYADLELNSLGTCAYSYRWSGTRYVQAGSRGCAIGVPPTLGPLSRAIRGR